MRQVARFAREMKLVDDDEVVMLPDEYRSFKLDERNDTPVLVAGAFSSQPLVEFGLSVTSIVPCV